MNGDLQQQVGQKLHNTKNGKWRLQSELSWWQRVYPSLWHPASMWTETRPRRMRWPQLRWGHPMSAWWSPRVGSGARWGCSSLNKRESEMNPAPSFLSYFHLIRHATHKVKWDNATWGKAQGETEDEFNSNKKAFLQRSKIWIMTYSENVNI